MSNFIRKIFPVTLILLTGMALSAQSQSSDEEFGLAAYYHDDFAGRETASGVAYNPNQLTAAHMRHPFNTMLKVTRLDNGKSVVVRVIDRGPYITGRVVDLSRAAAEKLGIVKDGVAEVKVEVVGGSKASKEQKAPAEVNKPAAEYNTTGDTRIEDKKKEEPAKKETQEAAAVKNTERGSTKASGTTPRPQLVGKEYQKYGLYKISIEKPGGKGFAVQVASLENYENVFQQVADLQAKWFDNILISIEKGQNNPVYKIMLGPFETESAAANYVKNLQKKHRIKGFVVNLSEVSY